MFLETARLILRKIREEDFADFCAYAMDKEMCHMMGRSPMDTEEAARANFDWLKNKEERCYGLVLKETGHVIGDLTVTAVQEKLRKKAWTMSNVAILISMTHPGGCRKSLAFSL